MPTYMPPPRLGQVQVVCGPLVDPGRSEDGVFTFVRTPRGAYDLMAVLRSQRDAIGWDPSDAEAVVVYADPSGVSEPRGIDAFTCPKLLLVGDTHHMRQPILTTLGYAISEDFDFHFVLYNRNHGHFFVAAGVRNIYWLPGVTVRAARQPFEQERQRTLLFVGQRGDWHPRRKRVLDTLERRGLPVRSGALPGADAAKEYGRSLLSFNCSLNGDLNLRVFEVLAAGGALVTDRLSPHSGIDELLREGEHYRAWDSTAELVEIVEEALRRPDVVLPWAQRGNEHYWDNFDPGHLRSVLWDLVFRGAIGWPMQRLDVGEQPTPSKQSLLQRIQVYQVAQDLTRQLEHPQLLLDANTPTAIANDLADLRRLNLFRVSASSPKDDRNSSESGCATPIVTRLAQKRRWDLVVSAASAPLKTELSRTIGGQLCDRVLVLGADGEAPAPDSEVDRSYLAAGLLRESEQLGLYVRTQTFS